MDDLAMDLETLHRVLTNMKIPKEKQNNYSELVKTLPDTHGSHPDCEQALKLLKIVISRLGK